MLAFGSAPLLIDPVVPRHDLLLREALAAFDPFDSDSTAVEPYFFSRGGSRNRIAPQQAYRGIAHGHSVLPKIEDRGDAGYVICVETPGIKREDLKVELVGRRSVCVSVSRPSEVSPSQPNDQITQQTADLTDQTAQTQPNDVQHSLQLFKRVDVPHDADTSKMHLTYSDGLLLVEIPRKDAASEQAISTEFGEECAEIEKEMRERAARVEELRAEMEKESRLALEARGKLRDARKEYASKVANERKELFFGQAGAPGAQI